MSLTPEWLAPPRNMLGGAVGVERPLVHTDDLALVVCNLTAYPTGLSFELDARIRRRPVFGEATWDDMWPPSGAERDDGPRFGVQFSDGRKVTTLDPHPFALPDPHAEPAGPTLTSQGSGGDGLSSTIRYWLWPLPPPGPLAFVCEWRARGVALTRVEIDAGAVIEAAGRATVLWPPDDATPAGDGGWSAY